MQAVRLSRLLAEPPELPPQAPPNNVSTPSCSCTPCCLQHCRCELAICFWVIHTHASERQG